jgi:hypothetical protein
MAIVLVLGLLSLTLALSYTMLRSQTATALVQHNAERPISARLAAQAGLSVALRKMREANWAGAETAFHGDLDSFTSYDVAYTTGDASLSAASPDFAEYPFRVTVISLGRAADPSNPTLVTTHRATAVVQLVRTKLNPPPANWAALQNYTLFYWGDRTLSIDPGARIEGAVNLQGMLELYPTVPAGASSRNRYLSDLSLMRIFGYGDQRPFTGSIALSASRVDSGTRDLLTDYLGVNLNYLSSVSNSAPLSHPGTITKYRLYPGGKEYTVPRIQSTYGSTLSNTSLGPDPLTNPLGVFRSSGALKIGSNVQITGTLLAESNSPLEFSGQGAAMQGYNLPPLRDATVPVQLPALLARDTVNVESASNSQITGLAIAWDRILVEAGSATTQFGIAGRLITYDLDFERRTNWSTSNGWWASRLNDFYDQLSGYLPPGTTRQYFFPTYLRQRDNLAYQPQLTVKPAASTVNYQWQDWSQPIYGKADQDPGLRWELISWKESR